MFVQPVHIPLSFTISVWGVLHNRADKVVWSILDSFPRRQALAWYREVLQANGCPIFELDREEEWFAKQLGGGITHS